MWKWDQGHLAYFQFDVLRALAGYAVNHDLASATRGDLEILTGLSFASPYALPWRNYGRVAKLAMLVSFDGTRAVPTPVAHRLAGVGQATADEYFHFLAQTMTDPSPALQGYDDAIKPRYPLLFAIRYMLTKAATQARGVATLNEIIGAYYKSSFIGDEGQNEFLTLLNRETEFEATAQKIATDPKRQARESLRAIAQISYLQMNNTLLEASLAQGDALDAFKELRPIATAGRLADEEQEIQRRSNFFKGGSVLTFFDYPQTVISDLAEAGFVEGGRIQKTHLIVERNAKLREFYFAQFAPTVCDMCRVDTAASYSRSRPILDLHHKLPLASGTRVEAKGTVMTDLVPICPTCHRAVHGFYTAWLRKNMLTDFANAAQANAAYIDAKKQFTGHTYA